MFLPLPESAVRQLIDSQAVYLEFRRAREAAAKFSGGMYFKREGHYEYLVKTTPDNRQNRLGARNEATEATFQAFTEGKKKAEDRLRSLQQAVTEAARLNKALRVGRVPEVVVAVLNAFDQAGLSEYFTVIGTHALYAYETAANVLIQSGALATQDVDLLWDARKMVQFNSALQQHDASVLKVLRSADASFNRMDEQKESAINDKGFMVNFLRRMATDQDPHPFRFSADEDDIWPVQAQRAELFLRAPKFSQVVVSTSGRMALMHTTSPRVFVDFKQWMAGLDSRPAGKRRRDALQAQLVQQLLDDALLIA